MIKWEERYSVDVPHIDKQHQQLFSTLNNFYEGLRNRESDENMARMIEKLLLYAKEHFATEEKHMQAVGFPGLDNHRKEHQAFIEKAEDFHKKFTSGKLLLSLEVTNFIKEWIHNHILTEDMRYKGMKRAMRKSSHTGG
ncbi:bacteriohemerythrin [Marinilabiliaceae bacterium ANBcel2]|nr:bacteriohemerythrin [Marinilabiliaceae bacterium ANBcel2]